MKLNRPFLHETLVDTGRHYQVDLVVCLRNAHANAERHQDENGAGA
jgi:hypothetical protein